MVATLSSANSGLGVIITVRGAHGGDKLARLGEEDVGVLGSLEAVDALNVGNKERRKLAITGSTFDVNIDTVLVHLTVADLQNGVSMVSRVVVGGNFGGTSLTVLNQVQDRIALPDFTPFGIGISHSCKQSPCSGLSQAL